MDFTEILNQTRAKSAAANTSETDPRLNRLPLVPADRRLLAHQPRQLDVVDERLLDVLHGLAEGKLRWPLLLFGKPGRGKSCAALALCDVVETAGFWTVDALCDLTMRRGVDIDAEWLAVRSKHLAVLDELGTRANAGELHYGVVKRFADEREQHRGSVAIFISNVAPKDLPKLYDDRIASRLTCGTVFEVAGDDRRRA